MPIGFLNNIPRLHIIRNAFIIIAFLYAVSNHAARDRTHRATTARNNIAAGVFKYSLWSGARNQNKKKKAVTHITPYGLINSSSIVQSRVLAHPEGRLYPYNHPVKVA